MSREQLLPAAERIRHGQLQAAMLTGPAKSPRGWGGWISSDLVNTDVWAAPPAVAQLPLAKQIAQLNGWIHNK